MKRPSFQFYPGDWTVNSNLKRCTHAEKGVWLEVMCLMHDQAEYGVLRWPLKEIIEAVKCKPADVKALVSKGVLKGSDTELFEPYIYVPRSGRKDGTPVVLLPVQVGPIWYSSRMVKDEYVRTIRGESTRFGDGQGDAPEHAPNPPLGDGSTASSSPSNSVPIGTGGTPPAPAKTPEDLTKAELWRAGKSLLRDQGMPEAQCGSFVGKLCKDHTDAIVVEAVRNTVVKQPADAASFLKSECLRLAGQRTSTKTTTADRRTATLQGLAGGTDLTGDRHDAIDVQSRIVE